MKKSIFMLLVIAGSMMTNAQVGIKTTTPQAKLHVDGNLQITKSLTVGGTENTIGNPGKENEILFSQGTGQPPIWLKSDEIQIPQEIIFAKKENATATITASTTTNISFDKIVLSDYKITVDSNTSPTNFTIKKAGNYQISLYVRYEIANPASGSGIATTNLTKNTNVISGQTSGYNAGLNFIDHNFTYSDYFDINDIIKYTTQYTRNYKIVKGSIAIQYLGN